MDHPRPILLYDGECGLCARSVQFVLDRDSRKRLSFAALQSDIGRAILAREDVRALGVDPNELSTLVLVDEHDRAAVRSTAALRVTRELRAPWPLMRAFLIVPRFIRDAVYRFVSRNRHRVPGTASCRLPDAETSERFVGEV